MKHLGLLLSWLGFIVGLHATELAPGLAYLRPGMAFSSQTSSAVLDLRYITDDTAASSWLASVQPGTAHDHRVILALVSPDTPAGLRNQLVTLTRCLTIGRAAPGFKTDIVVSTSAEADHRAFDALVAGTPPEKLIAEDAHKTRYDESSLIREHTGEPEEVTAAETANPAPATSAAPATPVAPPVMDAVLQRAVQIHRGLVVLKKL